MPVRFALGAACAALYLERTMNLIKEVKSAWLTREIKRLLPQASHKTEGVAAGNEPVPQRRNPARAAKRAARRAQP